MISIIDLKYRKLSDMEKNPIIYHPDITIEQSKEDYVNDVDTVLECAISYTKSKERALSIW